ncbi:MAG: hypothetical protein FWB95_00505 [Treponema sp.]|nr:hypothetical protein [Treponema sp.]
MNFNIKIIFISFAFFFIFSPNAHTQSNWPMATEIPSRDEPPVLHAPPEKRIVTHALVWEASPEMTLKNRQILTLRANTPIDRLPPPSFFMPKIPQNAILAPAPVTTREKSLGVVLKLTFIPLCAGSFILPEYTLSQDENTRFQIPALQITVKE